MKKTRFSFVGIENISTFAAQTKKQTLQSECSAVGSALRSGRRGRAFESPHSDKIKGNFLEYSKLPFISIQSLEQIQDGYVIKHNLLYHEKQDLSLYSSSSFFYVHQLHKNSNYPFRE